MKKRNILLGLMALTLVGGIGTAIAAITPIAGNASKSQSVDSVIELNWGSGSSTASIADVSDLKAGEPQYRSLAVTPKSSKSVAGNVTITFQISVQEAGKSATGLRLDVYRTDSLVAADAATSVFEAAINGKTASPSIVGAATSQSGETTLPVVAGEATHETNGYYVLKLSNTGAQIESGNEFGCEIIISQSFTPAP